MLFALRRFRKAGLLLGVLHRNLAQKYQRYKCRYRLDSEKAQCVNRTCMHRHLLINDA